MFVEDLVEGVTVWEASVNDVYELPSQVSFHVSIPWWVVLYDFPLPISVVLWLWVVRELVFVAALVKRFLVRRNGFVKNVLVR